MRSLNLFVYFTFSLLKMQRGKKEIFHYIPDNEKLCTSAILRVSPWSRSHVRITLCAPTGIAAQRMSTLIGHPAYTIHRLLGLANGWLSCGSCSCSLDNMCMCLCLSCPTAFIHRDSNAEHNILGSRFNNSRWIIHGGRAADVWSHPVSIHHVCVWYLRRTSLKSAILFVGDIDQLPSVRWS